MLCRGRARGGGGSGGGGEGYTDGGDGGDGRGGGVMEEKLSEEKHLADSHEEKKLIDWSMVMEMQVQ